MLIGIFVLLIIRAVEASGIWVVDPGKSSLAVDSAAIPILDTSDAKDPIAAIARFATVTIICAFYRRNARFTRTQRGFIVIAFDQSPLFERYVVSSGAKHVRFYYFDLCVRFADINVTEFNTYGLTRFVWRFEMDISNDNLWSMGRNKFILSNIFLTSLYIQTADKKVFLLLRNS